MSHIVAVVEEELGTFGISFPDLPGCVSHGETLDEVVIKGKQALALHLSGMAEDGDLPQSFRTPAEIRAAEPDWVADNALLLIAIDLPGKSQRINITLDGALLKRVDHAAQLAGQSRSGFIARALSEKIAR